MQRYKINVLDTSFDLIKEFKNYKWQPNPEDPDNKFLNKPVDAWNHGIDAARYWCMMKLDKGGRGIIGAACKRKERDLSLSSSWTV